MTLVTPPYHVGMIVPEVEAGMEEVTAALGVTWGRVQRRHVTLESPAGPVPVEVCYVYSLTGPPYLELIEQRPGTVFEALGLHHLGLWADDPAGESARLDGRGWPRETVSLLPDGSWGGGLFHTGAGALRLEVCAIARAGPRLVNYLGGGDYALPG